MAEDMDPGYKFYSKCSMDGVPGGVLTPRASAQFISLAAEDVTLSNDGSRRAAEKIIQVADKVGFGNFKQMALHPSVADEKAIDWIFLIDTLNFSFWTPAGQEKWTVLWKGETYTGYFALCAAVNRAMSEGMDITNPNFYGAVTEDQLEHIFRSDTKTPIPMIKERIEVLHEAGKKLLEKFSGSFVECVKASNKNAQELLKLIVKEFPAYRDEAELQGRRVSFYKRAQILIGDIWACFEGKGLGAFDDIEFLTMFADYRVPQPLVEFGVMSYSDELMKKLKKGEEMKNGDREEIEIRGCSIFAVEMIKADIRKLVPDSNEKFNSITIDHFLWDYRREHAQELEAIPYHQVRCIYY